MHVAASVCRMLECVKRPLRCLSVCRSRSSRSNWSVASAVCRSGGDVPDLPGVTAVLRLCSVEKTDLSSSPRCHRQQAAAINSNSVRSRPTLAWHRPPPREVDRVFVEFGQWSGEFGQIWPEPRQVCTGVANARHRGMRGDGTTRLPERSLSSLAAALKAVLLPLCDAVSRRPFRHHPRCVRESAPRNWWPTRLVLVWGIAGRSGEFVMERVCRVHARPWSSRT